MSLPSYRSAFSGSRCLVTGGLGFIGSNLARTLVALGAHVTVVDALLPGCGGNPFNLADMEETIRVERADLRDGKRMEELVAGQDFIFNLAGKISHTESMRLPLEDLELNARSHLSLLEARRKANSQAAIVYTSTRQVYGKVQRLPVEEAHPVEPIDINGVHKMVAEWYHRVYQRVHGLPTSILRLTNTYGPRMPLDSDRHGVVGWFLRLALEGRTIQLYGDGEQQRDLTYVDDVTEALLRTITAPAAVGQTYNLGGQEAISLRRLVEAILAACGSGSYELVPWPEERRRIDIGDYYSDYRRIRKTVGWSPKVGLEEGLARTVAFYREHGRHYF